MNVFGIIFSTTDIWLLGGCGAIILTWVGCRLANTLQKRNAIREPINKFIAVFTEFIHVLETPGALFTAIKMKDSIASHEQAAIDLRNILDSSKQSKFNSYWKEYRNSADKYYKAPFQLGFKQQKEEMLKEIEKLMKNVKRL